MRAQYAELVALGISEHDPGHVETLPDVDATCFRVFDPARVAEYIADIGRSGRSVAGQMAGIRTVDYLTDPSAWR